MEIALSPHTFKEFAVVTLSASYHRSHDEDFAAAIVCCHHVDDLLFCVFHHLLASCVTVGFACSGEEQTQVVVDFSRCTYGRTGILVGSLLFNADNGRQTCYLIHVRSLHASQEVTGIGREGFNIAALSFGKDGVEGQ